jgi:alginate production protein
VDEQGRWFAAKIDTRVIKATDKIKGTVTRVESDGISPDTLDISGLRVLLDEHTDLNEAESGAEKPAEKILFGELYRPNAKGSPNGRLFAQGALHVAAEYRFSYRSARDFDLSDQFRSDLDDTYWDVRLQASGYWRQWLRAHAEIRIRKEYVVESEQGRASPGAEVDFTELFVLVRDPKRGIALQVGRQNFDEPREFLFDEYLDAVRVYYWGLNPLVLDVAVIHAVAPLEEKFRTWTDFFAMARWLTGEKSHLGAYMLARADSDETRNREPIWWGVRYVGEAAPFLLPWFDASISRGQDKGKSVRAWAVDLGGTIRYPQARLQPSLTVGYAVASGDPIDSDDIDHTFRQTGYQDNAARIGGVGSFNYYGTVLGPELSNLHVWTMGVGARPFRRSSVDVVYHVYRQDELDDELRGSDLVDPPARPNGVSDDIGWALDVVLAPPRLWDRVYLRWTLGYFQPGEAFYPRQTAAVISRFDMTVRF